MTLFGSGSTAIADVGQQMKDLEKTIADIEKKEIKLSIDMAQLDAAKTKLDALRRGQAEWEAQLKKQTVAEAEAGKLAQQLIDESELGNEKIMEGLAKRREAQILAVSPALSLAQEARQRAITEQGAARKELATAGSPEAAQEAQRRLADAEKTIEESLKEEGRVRKTATTQAQAEISESVRVMREGRGAAQAEQRQNIATRLRSMGQGALAGQIAGTTPEALTEADKEAAEFDRHMDRAKAAGEIRRKIAAAEKTKHTAEVKAANEEIAFMNKAGAEFEAGQIASAKAKGMVAKKTAAEIASDTKAGIKDLATSQAFGAVGRGNTFEQVQAMIQAHAGGAIGAAGFKGPEATAAAKLIAADIMGEVRTQIGARVAEAGPGGRVTPRMAAGQLAAETVPKVEADRLKRQEAAQTAALAQNIQRMAPQLEGIQFTPAQAKAAADQAMKAMEHQVNADQAILMAMDAVLVTMGKAGNQFARMQMQAVRAQRQANGMGDFFDQNQPAAANAGNR
jgi:hypothetical protein